MAASHLLQLQASVTKTATFSSTGVDFKGNKLNPSTPLWAQIPYSAATNASGSNSVTFSIQESDDNSTFNTIRTGTQIDLSTTAQAGVQYLPIFWTKRYVRLVATFGGAGSTPTITYAGNVTPTVP